jgi:hypothetical protein
VSLRTDPDERPGRIRIPAVLAAFAVFAIAVTLVRPWGDYPVNDDWQYARVAKRFAAGQGLVVDVPIAPSLVGQVVFVAPIIRAFGFSHTLLRGTTLLLSLFVLFVLDRMMALAQVAPRWRILALCTVALNPLFFNLSASFMTEIYACVPALLGAWIWFVDRRERADVAAPVVRVWVAVAAGTLIGLSFWTRQFAVLTLPALWIASSFRAGRAGIVDRIRPLLVPVVASLLPALALTSAYFLWAGQNGAFRPELAKPLARLMEFRPAVIFAQSGCFATFLALSCLPLLLSFWRRRPGFRDALAGAALCAFGIAAAFTYKFMLAAPPGRFSEYPLPSAMGFHSSFPFIGNVFSEFGLGPVTLSDVYQLGLPGKPHLLPPLWNAIAAIALLANVLWVLPLQELSVVLRQPKRPVLATELMIFGLALSGLSFLVALQSYQALMFDRYYFPAILGMPLALAVLASSCLPSPTRVLTASAAAALLLLGAVTVSGAHNYFRWNDARWALYRRALDGGVERQSIEAGYEIQGWETFDLHEKGVAPTHCLGPCGCHVGWYCLDDSYRVAMNPLPGYRTIDTMQPEYWLASGPPVSMLQRGRRSR